MNEDEDRESLYDQLGDDDWALIIGSDGNLKGMFIPEGKDEDEVPYSIVHIMEKYFGIDFSEDDEDYDIEEPESGPTLH